jgi:hypothetical protein
MLLSTTLFYDPRYELDRQIKKLFDDCMNIHTVDVTFITLPNYKHAGPHLVYLDGDHFVMHLFDKLIDSDELFALFGSDIVEI